jgi:hypothetical protein
VNDPGISFASYNEAGETMKKLGWILAVAWWLYFLTSLFLYIHLGFKWVNSVDVILSFALLIVFSAWYVTDKLRARPGKSRWVIGWNGALYRRGSQACSRKQGK